MLKIKLFRSGKRNQPHYRIVVSERRSKRGGSYTDQIGTYSPLTNPPTIVFNQEKYTNWLAKGAQPTPTVKSIAGQVMAKPVG